MAAEICWYSGQERVVHERLGHFDHDWCVATAVAIGLQIVAAEHCDQHLARPRVGRGEAVLDGGVVLLGDLQSELDALSRLGARRSPRCSRSVAPPSSSRGRSRRDRRSRRARRSIAERDGLAVRVGGDLVISAPPRIGAFRMNFGGHHRNASFTPKNTRSLRNHTTSRRRKGPAPIQVAV
jgi:hypothetical protein